MSVVPAVKTVASRRWLFLAYAIPMAALAFVLCFVPWLGRHLLIATFVGVFALALTGFFVLLAGMVDAGAALGADLRREAIGWSLVLAVAAAAALAIFLLVSPVISVERLCYFVSIHTLALGFLEVRLAQRIRRAQALHGKKSEMLRGFAAASTTFFLLLLLPAIYGERFGIVVLAAYCLFFALELVVIPQKLREPIPKASA